MITVRFQGGLGNQMFQYCIYKAFESQGKEIQADIFYYSQNEKAMPFELNYVFPNINLVYSSDEKQYALVSCNPQRRTTVKILNYLQFAFFVNTTNYFYEMREGYFNKYILNVKKGLVEGFWQSEKYFSYIREDVRKLFQFRHITNAEILSYSELFRRTNSVSIHVRRGDYLSEDNRKLFGGICTPKYYRQAISYMKGKIKNAKFIVFSDNIDWVINHTDADENMIFVKATDMAQYENWYDMYLMSQCKHNIIANSSFSWWGAWLNPNKNKIVIAPRKWINGKRTPHILPENWVKM